MVNAMQSTWKLLKQHPWLPLPLLGIGAIVTIFSIKSPQPSTPPQPAIVVTPTPVATPVQAPQIQSPLPLASKANPLPKSASTKPPVPKGANDTDLTPAQAAINERAKAAFQSAIAPVDSVIEMRVAIGKGTSALTIGASTTADVLDEQGQKLGQLEKSALYSLQPDGAGIRLGDLQLPKIAWIEPAPGSLFYLGNPAARSSSQTRAYKGRLLLLSHAGRLWAVNYIDLRNYLYSVVGSEVSPDWSTAALKAQAIAARSYALVYYFRPAGSFFQLGDDEYYQVYSGTEREAETIRQAVDATSGEFVSYRGGVVESLYAASDDIVREAFQGRGMSQLGALNLAQKGWSDRQILTHYYPGTSVAKIVLDQE
jgi:peptidoglycan hydrolase-like amidase